MIDVLCANKGRVTNLKRVTYLCLDEADRMFDMGFEVQISRILQNIRPDRQTVLFSATFPRAIEATVRRILKNPLEISVRGKSVVSDTIEQHVEVVTEEDKMSTLLKLVADWYEKGSVLVFVDRQESTDAIWQQITASGYKCCSLHGGKDQMDRESTIKDFRDAKIKIMVATSVAARGLDIPHLRLVVNFDVPNHLEDYVHRVGRTGRAGNKGTAYTFITPEEEEFSRDLVKALKASKAVIPESLQQMYMKFESKRKQGSVKKHKSGFTGGHGYKFDEAEQAEKERLKKIQRRAAGTADGEEDVDEDENGDEGLDDDDDSGDGQQVISVPVPGVPEAMNIVLGPGAKILTQSQTTAVAVERIKQFAKEIASQPSAIHTTTRFTDEIEVNDYPSDARRKVTQKDAIEAITELTGCGITTKGLYIPPGRNPPPGIRKIYLFIEGTSAEDVRKAKLEIKRILDEAVVTCRPDSNTYGKYSVV
eukprot:TRINITY_DN0_c0_g1_i8.p1 TRINITY_DN0_c0_g1~~TRINITY_DN0_c0_g1_i8.p1  ORF type:complete len:479 (+),score=131.16 TRINITY_DN0_c0_g1_i8:1593-3029(+)